MWRWWRQDCNPDSNANSNPYPNKDCRSCDFHEHTASHCDADFRACSDCYGCTFANANTFANEHIYVYTYPANKHADGYSSITYTNHHPSACDRGWRARSHLW